MRRIRLLGVVLLTGLLVISCGDDDEPDAKNFVGSYQGNVVLTGGQGVENYAASVEIRVGTTADLLIDFLDMKNLRGTINGENTFRIDDQSVTLTDQFGEAFNANVNGNGTISGAALTMNGQIAGPGGMLAYQINASKL